MLTMRSESAIIRANSGGVSQLALSDAEIAQLEEPYVPHSISGH